MLGHHHRRRRGHRAGHRQCRGRELYRHDRGRNAAARQWYRRRDHNQPRCRDLQLDRLQLSLRARQHRRPQPDLGQHRATACNHRRRHDRQRRRRQLCSARTATGAAALGNRGSGLTLLAGASSNTIGGTAAGSGTSSRATRRTTIHAVSTSPARARSSTSSSATTWVLMPRARSRCPNDNSGILVSAGASEQHDRRTGWPPIATWSRATCSAASPSTGPPRPATWHRATGWGSRRGNRDSGEPRRNRIHRRRNRRLGDRQRRFGQHVVTNLVHRLRHHHWAPPAISSRAT